MSEKFNATCSICGKPYKICRTCQEIKTFTPWRTVTDTIQHYSIFLILKEYSKTKDKVMAKEALSNYDLSQINTFNDSVKKMILEIIKEEEKEEEIIEEPQIDEIDEEKVTPQKFARKNNSRKKYEVTNDDIE